MAISLKKNKGFTLAELMIVATLIGMLLLLVNGSNLFTQILKARDSVKKENLQKLQKVLEDFYANNNRYPTVKEMAYSLQSDVSPNWDRALAGRICGTEKMPTEIRGYINVLPCDARSPTEDYVYFVFNSGQKYAIFSNLENTSDPVIKEIGCQYGCSYFLNEDDPTASVSNNFFNYYVSSTDVNLGNCQNTGRYSACYPGRSTPGERCQACHDFSCTGSYATLYCKASWCLTECK